MYKDYIKEREGKDTLETEYGFIIYELTENDLFIGDIYVKPEFRKQNIGKTLIDTVESYAKTLNVKIAYAMVDTRALNFNNSLSFALSIGYTINKITDNRLIFLKKELK